MTTPDGKWRKRPSRGQRQPPLLAAILLVVVAALTVAALTTMGLNWLVRAEPFWSIPVPYSAPTANGWRDARGADVLELVKIALTVAAGLGGAVALTVAYRRQALAEVTSQRDEARAHRDRYGAAAAQLGDDDAAVRLAGVYAMSNLADDWEEQRQQCVDVLCAYLRLPWNPQHEPSRPAISETVEKIPSRRDQTRTTTTYGYPNQPGEIEVRRTILRVIADHLRGDSAIPGPWSNLAFDFTAATLPDINFSQTLLPPRLSLAHATFSGEARFDGATFPGNASFSGATFSGNAWFSGATFSEATWFDGATFSANAWFSGATFSGAAWFTGSTFSGNASFTGSTFSGNAWLDGATFSKSAGFDRATFSEGAWFNQATFSGAARFARATFSKDAGFVRATFSEGARFARATFSGNAQFDGATFSKGAGFVRATFLKGARFAGATFSGDAALVRVKLRGGQITFNAASVTHGTLLVAFPQIEDPRQVLLDGRPFTDWSTATPPVH